MPKRKQKLPRRTRRQTSSKPSDNEKNCVNPYNPNNTEECQSTNAKEFKHKNIDNSKDGFYTVNGSLNQHSKNMVKKDEESETKDWIENSTKHVRQLSNQSENQFNALKRNLKRPLDNITPSVDVSKRTTAFVNFRNESEDGNMPVILNVFTLCQVDACHSKQKTANILGKNSFPVTPPCSPPLLKLERVTAQVPPGNGLSRIKSNVCNINSSIKHHRENANTGLPTPINRSTEERNYSVQSHVVPSGMKLGSNVRFVPPDQFSDQERHGIFETNRCPNHSNCSELWQLAQRNHFLKNERSNMMKQELKNIVEESELSHLSDSTKSNVIICDKVKAAAFRGDKTRHFQHYELSPENVPFVSDHDNPVNDSNVFLSPRDIKVLELKKKIQEQEEALKKLRTVH